MPRPRRQVGTVFSVSPWQDKHGRADGSAGQNEDGGTAAPPVGYSVVELPLVVGSGGGSGGGSGSSSASGAASGSGTAAADMAVEMQTEPLHTDPGSAAAPAAALAAAAAVAGPGGGGWMCKKRKTGNGVDSGEAGGTSASARAALPGTVTGSTEAGMAEAEAATGEGDGGTEGSLAEAAAAAGALALEGTAYLALLPNGSITGHLVCPATTATGRRSFGLMGEVVVAGRECTRDADWGVLRMTLVNFSSSSSIAGSEEVSFLVERTEGDAMRLRAPVPWQGIELEQLPELDAACSCSSSTAGLLLDFRCQQLLSGPAADALLHRLQPSLAGRGALLNVGGMRVELPPEAAAPLLGQPQQQRRQQQQQAGGASWQAPTPPAAPPPPAAALRQRQQQQQRVYTGAGNSSGRVVQDGGDDW